MIHTGMKVIDGGGATQKVFAINSKGEALLTDGNWYKVSGLKETENDCWLEKEPFFQCCCKCIYRVDVKLHCHDEHDKSGCICGVQTGFACTGFESENVIHANWPEHSIGCEMYTTKEQAEKWSKSK